MSPAHNYRSDAAFEQAMATYESALSGWPVPLARHRIPTRHGEAFVLEFGKDDGPVLMLLHGSAANSSTWRGEAAYYAKRFRVLAVDLPGETGKSAANRAAYGGRAYVEYLEDVVSAFALERLSLVGLSLGGWAGMRFAAAHPERVERLALIAPGGLAPARKGFILKALLYRPFGAWGVERIARVVFAPEPIPPGVLDGFAFGLRNYQPRRDNLPLITDDELRQLSMPVLYLGGEGDRLLDTAASAGRLRELVPQADVRVLQGRGHGLVGTVAQTLPFLIGVAEPAAASR